MGVKVRKRGRKWYVYVDHHGRRICRSVGTSRELAERVRRQLEAKLALGDDQGVFGPDDTVVPMFDTYANQWLAEYARVECKTSTADGYEGVLSQYLRPKFAHKRLDEIKRDDVKALINSLIAKDLSRNTIRNALCVIRGIFNQAIESNLIEINPAARLGRFTRTAKTAETKGVSLRPNEVQQFLCAAREVCSEYYSIFLTALRAGLTSWRTCRLAVG